MVDDDGTQLWSESDTVQVHRFEYFDRAQGQVLRSEDYATEAAIREMGGQPVEGTAIVVHRGRVSWSGILKRAQK
jgi:hypothetical protein